MERMRKEHLNARTELVHSLKMKESLKNEIRRRKKGDQELDKII